MRLSINGEQATYTLENERTLGEVVKEVQAWLGTAGFIVSGLAADESDLLATPANEWSARDVATVKELRVSASHTGDIRIAHWRSVGDWLGLLDVELAAQASPPPAAADTLDDLLGDLAQTLEGFSVNPFLPPGADAGRKFEAMLRDASPASVRSWTAEQREAARALVAELRARVAERISAAENPRETLARRARSLKESLARLAEVSVLLQTGRDRQAMEAVIGFTDCAQSLMEVLPFLPADAERARLFTELTPVLRELVAAFGARDSILIGDLLEYEIAPRMERITPLLEKAP